MSESRNGDHTIRPHQNELRQLGELAGIYMDQEVFSSIIELLNMGVDPNTIYEVLEMIRRSTRSRLSTESRSSTSPK